VHDPGLVIGVFEGDGDAMLENQKSLFKCLSQPIQYLLKNEKTFYAPNGEVVDLPQDALPTGIFYKDEGKNNPAKSGSLAAFEYSGKLYEVLYETTSGKFGCYSFSKNCTNDGIKSRTKTSNDKVVNIELSEDYESTDIKINGQSYTNAFTTCQEAEVKEYIRLCDANPFNQKHELLLQTIDGTTTWGEKIVKQINAAAQNNTANKFGGDLQNTAIKNADYILVGSDYHSNAIFQGGYTLEELNKKMAYLEISKGYQLYTKFIDASCSFTQQIADGFAKDILDNSNISKQNGIICLVLYNNTQKTDDAHAYTIGLAFGSNVQEAGKIKNILLATPGDVRKNIVASLIEAYKTIPKKRVVYNYFIGKVPQTKINARQSLINNDKPYGELRGTLKTKVDIVENEKGNAIGAEYYIYDETTNAVSNIIDVQKELKEEYVADQSSKLALWYGKQHAGWDLNAWNGSRGRQREKLLIDNLPKLSQCYFTLNKSCKDEVIDNAFLLASMVTPQRYLSIPIGAAILYYASTDQWNEVGAYLIGFGLAEVVAPVIEQASSKTLTLIKAGAKKLADVLPNDLKVALEFKNVINKGLSEDAIKLLYSKQLSSKCYEYIIPYDATKNLFIKLSENVSNATIDKILVGSIETINGEAKLVIRGYKEGANYTIASIDNVRLKELAKEVMLQGAGSFFKVGDNIIGKVIQKVRPGTNGKIAVIGRRMPGHVEDVAAALKAEGKQVEIFSELDQKNNLFNNNGSNKSWDDIADDFKNTNGQYLSNNGRILDCELPKTMMYKANKIWTDKLKTQGYTVIDMGYPVGQTLPQSVFYDMELLNLFP
ncbi:MAG TPA: hypothetical protein PK772_06685, partial [Chitinophagaceae bacterium]|nr:hypothetical protein [Chitinophagaceae bacterium]